ncbi:MAG TPA: ATP-binding SpoIIE family protein phosphatase, partial [bacterium]
MRSPVLLKLAESLRSGLGEFATRWIKYIRTNDLAPDSDVPEEEAVNRARLGFEVLANLIEGAEYEKYENVVRRLIHDWINQIGTFSELVLIEQSFPDFIITVLDLDPISDEAGELRDQIDDFFQSELRVRILTEYLFVYEDIIGAESRHTAYVLAHFDSLLSLGAHLNAADTREDIFTGLGLHIKNLYDNVLGTFIWTETYSGLQPQYVNILDEEIPPSMVDPPSTEKIDEVFTVNEIQKISLNDLPSSLQKLLKKESSRDLMIHVLPVRPRESEGLLAVVAAETIAPAPITQSLSRIAASEIALALDRSNGRSRILWVNRNVRDILSYGRQTSWGTGYHETCETTIEYLMEITGATRALMIGGKLSGSSDLKIPVAWRGIDKKTIEHYESQPSLHPIAKIAHKGKKILLLDRDKLIDILKNKPAPEGLDPGPNEALGILPLESRGIRQGIILYTCPSKFIGRPETIDILQMFCHRAGASIATAREYEKSLIDQRLNREDTDRARTIQALLTPRFRRSGAIEFWSHIHAAGDLAGDVITVKFPDEGRMNIWAVDVSGRGRSAGWSMMLLRQLISDYSEQDLPLIDIVHLINDQLHSVDSVHTSDVMFASAIAMEIDEEEKFAKIIRAGAPQVYHVSEDGTVEGYNPDGFPLGLFPDPSLNEISIRFKPGDKFAWASDGLLSSPDSGGTHWGEERLLKTLKRFHHLPPRAVFEEILAELGEYSNEEIPRDDRSLLVVGCRTEFEWTAAETGACKVDLCVDALDYIKTKNISERDLFALRTLIDEAIKNADEHGNKSDPNAEIEIKISTFPRYVHIAVRDQGGNLNEKVTSRALRAENILEDKGRGFLLMRHQADYLWVEDDIGELNAIRLLEVS